MAFLNSSSVIAPESRSSFKLFNSSVKLDVDVLSFLLEAPSPVLIDALVIYSLAFKDKVLELFILRVVLNASTKPADILIYFFK